MLEDENASDGPPAFMIEDSKEEEDDDLEIEIDDQAQDSDSAQFEGKEVIVKEVSPVFNFGNYTYQSELDVNIRYDGTCATSTRGQ